MKHPPQLNLSSRKSIEIPLSNTNTICHHYCNLMHFLSRPLILNTTVLLNTNILGIRMEVNFISDPLLFTEIKCLLRSFNQVSRDLWLGGFFWEKRQGISPKNPYPYYLLINESHWGGSETEPTRRLQEGVVRYRRKEESNIVRSFG